MRINTAQCLGSFSLAAILLCASQAAAQAAPIPVRHIKGTVHGFLELKSDDGHVIASGDMTQIARGSQVTSRMLFTFKDGSVDDETTVYSQRRNFQLITYHHIQKGPSFPHPIELLIDARSGQVTVKSTGKDGKEDVKTDHLKLPPDLANGLVPSIIENIGSGAAETKVSILATTPSPRLVTLSIASHGEEPFSIEGSPRKAIHYEIKIELGGVAGVVAPLIGKQPPNIQIWIIGGPAPCFLKETGPLFQDGPVTTIQLASPIWPD
jgi:hypothetical protein